MVWLGLLLVAALIALFFVRTGGPPIDHLDMVGKEGVAEQTFSHEGKVLVSGELWRATTRKGIIRKGDPIKVQSVEPGLLLVVESVKDR